MRILGRVSIKRYRGGDSSWGRPDILEISDGRRYYTRKVYHFRTYNGFRTEIEESGDKMLYLENIAHIPSITYTREEIERLLKKT